MINVIVCGAAGRMGQQTARTILEQDDMRLVGCVDKFKAGESIESVLFGKPGSTIITDNLSSLLNKTAADVMVDFTHPEAAADNILKCLAKGISCIVGTTGLKDEDQEKIRIKSEEAQIPVFYAPNFSVGAALMMKFAKEAAKFYEWAEIIELHHEKKADAPSGTALRTAELMAAERESFNTPKGEFEKVAGSRGGSYKGLKIHSVRLPGYLAHQKVMLGGVGEILTIHHDSTSRECFMPGVMMSIRKVRDLEGVVVGIENIM